MSCSRVFAFIVALLTGSLALAQGSSPPFAPPTLPGIYTFATLPTGNITLGTPATTKDQGTVYWNGSTWQSTPYYGGGVSIPIPLSDLATQSPGTVACVPNSASSAQSPTACARNVYYALDFSGVLCNNSHDDGPGLQNFFNAVNASRFAMGVLPPGVCRSSVTLSFPTNYNSIAGAGRYSTVLYYIGSSTTADIVDIFGTSQTVVANSNTYSGFSVQSASVMTGGAGIHVKYMTEVTLTDFATGSLYDASPNHLYVGTKIESSGEIYLHGFDIATTLSDGMQVFGQGVGNPPQYDLFATKFIIQGNAGAGVHIGGGWDGANFDSGEIASNQTNVVIDHALAAYGNQEVIFGPSVYISGATGNATNVGDNVLINDSDASVANLCNITIQGPITLSAHENGVNVESWPACPVNILSTAISNNTKSGVYVQDTSALVNVSPQTFISANSRYAVEASAATSNVNVLGPIGTNTLGQSLNLNSSIINGHGQTTFEVDGVGVTNFFGGTAPHIVSSPIYYAGTAFTASNSCGGTITYGATTPVGGYFTVGTGGTNCLLTMTIGGANPVTAPHGWFCSFEDFTAKTLGVQSTQTATTCTGQLTLTANDIVLWGVVTGY